jgi:hypothetical protein
MAPDRDDQPRPSGQPKKPAARDEQERPAQRRRHERAGERAAQGDGNNKRYVAPGEDGECH